jgi:NAD(P)-dependent dehydrogenase (short-subunit alcohol dehydrogenase family)
MFSSSTPKFTAASIPDLTGRTILVTGGNAGLGKATILALARKNAKIYMASRTESKARAAIEEIKTLVPTADVTFIALDLMSFESVVQCAKQFLELETRLHCLINNAGVMAMPYSETTEGYEIQFGTNHMGHFLLTRELLPALEKAAQESPAGTVRIVNVSSVGHNLAFRGMKLEGGEEALKNQLKSATTWERYGVAKLANILHARELSKRYPNILAVSCHPGVIMSDLYDAFVGGNPVLKAGVTAMKLVTSSIEDGALNQLFCAVGDVNMADNGEYYVPVGKKAVNAWWHEKPSKLAKDRELATRLWEWSEEEVKKHGYADKVSSRL